VSSAPPWWEQKSDGTQIAPDVWLPVDLELGQQVPTMLRAVRYWRGFQPGPVAQVFQVLGMDMDAEYKAWAEAGYALVTVVQ
jgi:hypothetical protein